MVFFEAKYESNYCYVHPKPIDNVHVIWFILPRIKKALVIRKNNRIKNLFRALQAVDSIQQEKYHKSFESWRKRLQKYIKVRDDYFEEIA